jgi:tetratricopeptide (TPR) repeat protein
MLDQLADAVRKKADVSKLDQMKHAIESASTERPSSSRQRLRFWFLLGFGYYQQDQWEPALQAFDECNDLLQANDLTAAVLLYFYQATSMREVHRFDEATVIYQRLIETWEFLMAKQQALCFREDAQAFLCNLYRQCAATWRLLGSCTQARKLIESHVLPITECYFSSLPTPIHRPPASANEQNWRLLRIFALWESCQIAIWQAKLRDRTVKKNHLRRAISQALEAVRLSEQMEGCAHWTANLLTSAAEAMIQHCRQVDDRDQQRAICQEARRYLELAFQVRWKGEEEKIDQLRRMVLDFPSCELRYCELLAGDDVQDIDTVLEDLQELQQRALKNTNRGAQVLAARCVWLQGDFVAHGFPGQPQDKGLASKLYHQALKMIPKKPDPLTMQIEHAIYDDINRLRT